MIVGQLFKRPYITFGLGEVAASADVDQVVDVWVTTIHNSDTFQMVCISDGGTVEKISNYHFKVTHTSPGEKQINVFVSNKSKGGNIKSNTLKLTIT